MRTLSRKITPIFLLAAVLAVAVAACATTEPFPPDSGTAPGDSGTAGSCQNGDIAEDAAFEVELRGNEEISERLLKRAAGDSLIVLATGRRTYQADDAAYAMESYCRDEGYHTARVGYKLVGTPPTTAVFDVHEGPRAVLGDISLKGRAGVPRHRLTPFFRGAKTGWIGGETLFVRGRVENAARTIQAWYRSEGYLDAEVTGPEVTFNKEGTRADVGVVIDAGLQYFIRELRFETDGDVDPSTLREALDCPEGTPFTRSWAQKAEKRLYAFLRDHGFWRPQVGGEPDADPSSGDVIVRFRIVPGGRRTVGHIAFEGQEKTEEGFLRSFLQVEEGATFHGGRLRETGNRIYGTGLFNRVDVKENARADDRIDLLFAVEERDPFELSFLGGYGSYEMFRGAVTFSDRNLFGKGLRWTSAVKASMKSLRTETSLTDQAFLDMPLKGTVGAYADRREFPSFLQQDYGGVASVSKRGGPLQSTIGYSYEQSTTRNAVRELRDTGYVERASLGSVFLRWVLDFRDSGVNPHRGSLNELKLEAADEILGGDLDFNRITAHTTWLFPLDGEEEWILACGARGGLIVRRAGTNIIPLQHRFFNGGDNSVRSFREHELGPKVGGEPLGGEFFSTARMELRAPLYGNLGSTFFADGGNVRERRGDADLRDYRFALGVGLRYGLPIGPVRLDWGWNPNRRTGEDLWVLHLGVGYAF
jgi:outer membrane protein insertion porin family